MNLRADIIQLDRWIVVEAVGATIELIYVVFAAVLVWNIQMATKSKVAVISGFALRLP